MNNIKAIARIAHEANKAYCESIGDYTQKHWDDADEWQRQSAINGVKALIDDATITPEILHEKWCFEKIENGWVYGKSKDVKLKTHPCLVPYNQLPNEQQIKDYLFLAIVNALK